MTSRKDFERIAAAIKVSKRTDYESPDTLDHNSGVLVTARNVADALVALNDTFDRDRFLRACGVGPEWQGNGPLP